MVTIPREANNFSPRGQAVVTLSNFTQSNSAAYVDFTPDEDILVTHLGAYIKGTLGDPGDAAIWIVDPDDLSVTTSTAPFSPSTEGVGWVNLPTVTAPTLTAGVKVRLITAYADGATPNASNYWSVGAIKTDGDPRRIFDMKPWDMAAPVNNPIFLPSLTINGRYGNPYTALLSGAIWGTRERGQTAALSDDTLAKGVGFTLWKSGRPTFNVGYKVYDSSDTVVRSGLLVNAANITATSVSNATRFYARFSSPLTITAEEQYRYVIYVMDGTSGDSNNNVACSGLSTSTSGDYESQSEATYGGSNYTIAISNDSGVSWSGVDYGDIWFDIIGEREGSFFQML